MASATAPKAHEDRVLRLCRAIARTRTQLVKLRPPAGCARLNGADHPCGVLALLSGTVVAGASG